MKNTNPKKSKDKIVKIITLILIIICLYKLIDMTIDYQQIKLSSDFVQNDPILGPQIESFYSRLKILPIGLILTIILRLLKKNSLALIAIILTLLMTI